MPSSILRIILHLVVVSTVFAGAPPKRDLGPEIGTRAGTVPHPHRVYDQYFAHHRDRDAALEEIAELEHWQDEAWRKDVLDYAYRKGKGGTGRTFTPKSRRPTVEPLTDTRAATTTALEAGANEVWEGGKKIGSALGEKLGEGWRAGKRGAKRLGRRVQEGAAVVGEKVWETGEELYEKGSDYVDDDDDD